MSLNRKNAIASAKYAAISLLMLFFIACDDSTSAASSDPVAEISSSSGDKAIHSSSSVDSIGSSSSATLTDDEKSSSSVEKSEPSSSSVTPTSSANAQSSSSKVDDSSASVKPESSSTATSSAAVASSSSAFVIDSAKLCTPGYAYCDRDLGTDSLHAGAYKQFTDPRNGRSYYYLTIDGVDKDGNPASVTVFAENLNIGVMVDGDKDQTNDLEIERYCYDNDTTNCDKYGGLYQWAEMMKLSSECNTKSCANLIKPNHQGICPDGWRLLTEDDFYIVMHANGHKHGAEDVRATSFGGYNNSGYSLLGAGYNWAYEFDNIGSATQWFYPVESIDYPDEGALIAAMSKSSASDLSQNVYKTYGSSVRCVMVE